MKKTQEISQSNKLQNIFYKSLCVVALFGVLVFTAGCTTNTNQPQVPNQPTNTPEQAWKTYVQGWKDGNLEEILSACAPTRYSQERCREQFTAAQESNHIREFAELLEKGTLTLKTDLEELRYYIFSANGEGTTVTFEFSTKIGWKLREF